MHASNFTVSSIFGISIIYLAHNLGSATEMIINIKLPIKLQFNNRNTIYQNKVY